MPIANVLGVMDGFIALDANGITLYHGSVLNRYGKDASGRPVKKAVVYTKAEHGIRLDMVDADARRIIERLADGGFSAYIVGGAVRDLVVGNVPKDFDIVTDAKPTRIKKMFRSSRIIGKRFRLVHIFVGSKIFEVSTFRSTVGGSIGNNFGSMDEDVKRRDFSMNALYYDPIKEQVIDYVDGVRDIRRHVLCPVIPLDRIFTEDPVRMIRAVKYSVTTDAKMSFLLRHKIKHSAYLLSDISPSRLTEELLKIINGGHAKDIISEAIEMGLYKYIQPNANSLIENDKDFAAAYMASLARMDAMNGDDSASLAMKLECMIKDYLKGKTDWQKAAKAGGMEGVFVEAWTAAREFVLPINPPRAALVKSIRGALQSFGVASRPPRRRCRLKDKKQETDKQGSAPALREIE